MTAENFCYWLQGYLKRGGAHGLTAEQEQIVDDYLKLVLEKKAPAQPTKEYTVPEILKKYTLKMCSTDGKDDCESSFIA